MRLLAIGDIHGCSTAFDNLLEAVGLQQEDQLITLGDYVDKGPQTRGVLERLLELYENHQLIPLTGNHEIMMLEARKGGRSQEFWLSKGGDKTLDSYSQMNEIKTLDNIPNEHWNFLKNSCLAWYETDTHIFVHANAAPHLPMAQQSPDELFWQKFSPRDPHDSGKILICGHTSQKDGRPINLVHRICLDTWVCGNGWLSCLDVDTGKIWQTNQQGQWQIGFLEEFQGSFLDELRL